MPETLLTFIDQSRQKVIELHRQLLKRVAINPEHGGKGEEKKARWVEQWLHKNGLCKVSRIDSHDPRVPNHLRPNLLAVYQPEQCQHMLWIVTHLDTVASGAQEYWDSNPFVVRIDNDRLFGRGVEDNNQAIVSALLLLDGMKELDAKQMPKIGLGLICVSAGLTDYTKGLDVILKQHPELFKPSDLVVVPDYGNEKGSLIEVSEKRSLWLKITITGEEHHAGYDDKTNAFEACCLFVSKLDPIRKQFAFENKHYIPPVSTITPTHCETSCTGLNHVAARFSFYLDIRLMPDCPVAPVIYALQRLARTIEKKENVQFEFEQIEISPDAPVTPVHAPVIRLLSKAIKTELNVTPQLIGVGGATMVSVIRALGVPVAVWSIQSGSKVKTNESISIKAQIAQTRILARLLYTHKVRNIPKVGFTLEQRTKKLTPAEINVARLIGKGMTNEQITLQLNISDNTVRTHLKSLYRKTGAENREELYRLCLMLSRPEA